MIAPRHSTRIRPALRVLLSILASVSFAACDTALLYIDHDAHDASDAVSDAYDSHLDIVAYDVPPPTDTGAMCANDMDCAGNPAGTHCDLDTQMCRPCLAN